MFKVKNGCLAHTHTLQSQENSPHLLSNLHDFFFLLRYFPFFVFQFSSLTRKDLFIIMIFVFELKSDNFEF